MVSLIALLWLNHCVNDKTNFWVVFFNLLPMSFSDRLTSVSSHVLPNVTWCEIMWYDVMSFTMMLTTLRRHLRIETQITKFYQDLSLIQNIFETWYMYSNIDTTFCTTRDEISNEQNSYEIIWIFHFEVSSLAVQIVEYFNMIIIVLY